jgi:hypothetical protein
MKAFWHIATYNLVGVGRLFRSAYCLNHQDHYPEDGGNTHV